MTLSFSLELWCSSLFHFQSQSSFFIFSVGRDGPADGKRSQQALLFFLFSSFLKDSSQSQRCFFFFLDRDEGDKQNIMRLNFCCLEFKSEQSDFHRWIFSLNGKTKWKWDFYFSCRLRKNSLPEQKSHWCLRWQMKTVNNCIINIVFGSRKLLFHGDVWVSCWFNIQLWLFWFRSFTISGRKPWAFCDFWPWQCGER